MEHDTWHWRAVYGDGSQLDEYEGDGTCHGFADVDQDRLQHLVLLPQREGAQTHVATRVSAPINFFRRRSIEVNPATDDEGALVRTVHCLEMSGHYTFLFDDGSVLVSDDLDAV